MSITDANTVFRRVGWALVVFGAIDTALFVWALEHGVLYPSSFNVLAIVAGWLMARGSLAAAALVRWVVAFTLACVVAALVAAPALVPADLVVALWRFQPGWFGACVAAFVLGVLLFLWMQVVLDREVVTQALAAVGKGWRQWTAVVAGVGSTLILAGLVALILRGGFATEAVARAKAHLGPGYRCQVVLLGVFFERSGPYVSASVAGWNDRELRLVPVRWSLD